MTQPIRRGSAEARAFKRQHDRDTASRRGDAHGAPRDRRAGQGNRADNDHEADFDTLEKPGRQPRFAPVTFSEEGGVRFLHFATEWVQGAMRLSRPWRIELEYAQQMMSWLLFLNPPARVAQLGLGAAALTKFCYREFNATEVTAVELNPAVVVAARTMFALPADDARLSVIESDAWDFVTDARQRGAFGALQVDLYDATARGPVLDSVAFYRACRNCLQEPGMLVVNLFGDHPSFARNMRHIRAAFGGRALALPEVHEGNRVVLAFNGPALDFSWSDLAERAAYLQKTFALPAKSWVKALRNVCDNAPSLAI
ncbi:MAG: spermidine synthase [Janthinobacterium lividum]